MSQGPDLVPAKTEAAKDDPGSAAAPGAVGGGHGKRALEMPVATPARPVATPARNSTTNEEGVASDQALPPAKKRKLYTRQDMPLQSTTSFHVCDGLYLDQGIVLYGLAEDIFCTEVYT